MVMAIQVLPRHRHPDHVYPHHYMLKQLFKLVVFDASQYLMQYFRPTVDVPAGDTIFDLNMVPRFASTAFYALCGYMIVFAIVGSFTTSRRS